jgi:hypothetical protein
VLARVEKMGDLFEPVQKLKQKLPQLAGLAAPDAEGKKEDEGVGMAAQAEARPRPRKKIDPATKGKSAAGKRRKL